MTSVASGVPMISCGVMRSRTGHDRERIAVDQVPRSSDAHAQAARDLGEQARDHKLRQSDPEPAHAEREQRQARPPPRDSGGRPSGVSTGRGSAAALDAPALTGNHHATITKVRTI